MTYRIISRVTSPMAEASQMEGRMKALRPASWTFAFPGQAGVPANALTDAEYHQRHG